MRRSMNFLRNKPQGVTRDPRVMYRGDTVVVVDGPWDGTRALFSVWAGSYGSGAAWVALPGRSDLHKVPGVIKAK